MTDTNTLAAIKRELDSFLPPDREGGVLSLAQERWLFGRVQTLERLLALAQQDEYDAVQSEIGLQEQYEELERDRDGKGFLRDLAEAKIRRLEEQFESLHEAVKALAPFSPAAEMRWMSMEDATIEVPARAVAEATRALRVSNPAKGRP